MSIVAKLRVRVATLLTAREQQVRFLVAGGINTVFGLGLYPVLLWSSESLKRNYFGALVFAQFISLCFAFTVYKLLVFKTKGVSLREIGTFASFYVFNYVVSWAALPLLVEFGKIKPIPAQFGFNCVLIVGSYLWHSRVTFRDRSSG